MYLFQPLFVDSLPQPFRDEIRGISNATGIEIGNREDTYI